MIVLYAILGLLALLIAMMAVNTVFKRPAKTSAAKAELPELNADKLAEHLGGMIRFKTVTADSMERFDRAAFLGLHEYLEQTYPRLHTAVEKEIVNEYSLLYKWNGTGSEQKPWLMMAHMDVVPVDERTADLWAYPAFSGAVADGYVWGRGALDMKGQLASIMESVEHLLEQGFAPERDIYIALGHDEESMGSLGTQRIVDTLKERGVRLDFVIDEGGVVMDGKPLSIDAMVATIGICEKGYADFRLTAESPGGHASRPPKQTAVGALAAAIVALEKHKMKPTLNEPLKAMMNAVGGYMKFPLNVIAANLFITKPLLLKGMAAGSTGSAMVRTTTAPTMLKGSGAPNVLAERAEAVVNFRISPDDSVEKLLAHVKRVVGDKIKVEIMMATEPSVVSSVDSAAYQVIERTVSELFHGHVVTPYLMIAATDSRRYAGIADGIYRFQPFASMSEDLGTIHAAGERLSIDSLLEGTAFFIQLVKNADK